MDRPEKLVLDDGSCFNMGRIGVFGEIGMMMLITAMGLARTDTVLADLALPFAALVVLWLL